MTKMIASSLAMFVLAGLNCSAVADTHDVPLTAWGKPDLSGIWTTATLTPLERPMRLIREGGEPVKELFA